MALFKVGEKALFVAKKESCAHGTSAYVGCQVTVRGPLRPSKYLKEGQCYDVQAPDGTEFQCVEKVLQKLPPPKREPLGRWEDVPFYALIKAPREPVEAILRT